VPGASEPWATAPGRSVSLRSVNAAPGAAAHHIGVSAIARVHWMARAWYSCGVGGATNLNGMGQPVAVVEKPSATPGVVRFEANRNLTGSGHERFVSYDSAVGPRPAAVLARRLFDSGRVDAVHIYANLITVNLKTGFQSTGLEDIVNNLYTYYVEGFVPPALIMPEAEPAAAAPAAGAVAGGPVIDSRVPPHLVERSRAALAKWKAEHPE
jgi:hypothetical protein